MGGIVQRRNTATSKYTPGRLNSRRSRGASTNTIKTETNSNALVYFERKPSPISRPVTGQYQEKRGLFSKASQNVNIPAIQKKIESASIVIRTAPTLKIGVAFKAITAQRAAVGPNRRRAK